MTRISLKRSTNLRIKALLSHCVSFGSGRSLRGCETKIKNFPKKVPNKYFDVKVEAACDEEKQKDKNAKVCGSGQRRPEKMSILV